MLKITATKADNTTSSEIVLFDENNRPTKLMMFLAGAELAFDVTLGIFLGKTIFRRRK